MVTADYLKPTGGQVATWVADTEIAAKDKTRQTPDRKA